MKKIIPTFSILSLVFGLSCFLCVIYIGFNPMFGGRGFFWKDFFNLIFQPTPVFIIPIISCALLISINIVLIVKYSKKNELKLALKRIHVFSMGIVLFLLSVALLFLLKESARRTSCVGNIFQIKLALHMYSNAYNGQFPNFDGVKGLELLRKTGFLENPQCYICPSSGRKAGKYGEPLTEETVDYIYRGGYSERDNMDIGILYDKKYNHHNFGNIVFIDGHVERFFGNNWQKRINPNRKDTSNLDTVAAESE